MKEKKHIDELFKDHLKNFEVKPSDKIWESIRANMKKENDDRKIIPLWWKLGGVAAILAVILTIGNSVLNPFDSTNTITQEVETNLELPESGTELIYDDYINKPEIASEEIETPSTKESSEAISEKDVIPIPKKSVNTVQKNAIAESQSAVDPKHEYDKSGHIHDRNSEIGMISNKEPDSEFINKDRIGEDGELKLNNKTLIDDTVRSVAEELNDTHKDSEQPTPTDEREEELNKPSLLDVIQENKESDAIVKANDVPENRWDVSPNFAPVYYNTLGEGSSIDPSFSDNPKSGEVNLSYGVQISYLINNRLSIRTGINSVDLSYATSDLELGTAPVSEALKTIDYRGRELVTTAVDKGTFSNTPPGDNPFGNITPKSTSGEVKLIQDINYYEVPLELKYALLDTKLGVNIIGGFSTLLLGDNIVYVQADNLEETLGGANNLSSFSFSTNLGFGLDYKLTRSLKFNIEPMFKYQLNPYKDSSVSFKPYYVGVYTGLSFRF